LIKKGERTYSPRDLYDSTIVKRTRKRKKINVGDFLQNSIFLLFLSISCEPLFAILNLRTEIVQNQGCKIFSKITAFCLLPPKLRLRLIGSVTSKSRNFLTRNVLRPMELHIIWKILLLKFFLCLDT